MHNAVAAHLPKWENFYIIVGSAGAALTGLQFVVIALIAEAAPRDSKRQVSAFGTPTVVHFCAVLLLGAILSAPWGALSNVALAIGASGLAGVAYVGIVIKRARLQTGYKPDLGDWVWHTALPLFSYTAIVLAAIVLHRSPASSLFVIGGAALLLLFTGIHNAWDAVTYIAVGEWKSAK
ncbi:MAG TPA: hypothetical protein VER38_03605 [Candidatus Eisenbacteria bacterium]|nr:hypothetical protein [Candidatus Eisenbacteria bacterium]